MLKPLNRFVFIVLVICGAGFFQRAGADGYQLQLELLDTSVDRVVHTTPVAADSRFTLKYIHSVEKTPVFETYRILGTGDIYLEETIVKSSGYGLPEAASTGCYRFEDGWLRIMDFNEKIEPLVFRVSYLNDMLLMFEDHTVNLPDISVPGHRIEVRIRKNP